MRILWVKIGGLWPLNTGGRLRSFHLLSELSRSHAVTLLTTHGPDDDPEALARQLPACTVISIPYVVPKLGSLRFAAALARSWLSTLPVDVSKFRIPAVAAEVRRLIGGGRVDLCVADFLSATATVPLESSVPVLFFAHNIEHQIWRRFRDHERRWWRRPLLELEWRKMRAYEARVCARSGLTVSVSDADCTGLLARAPAATICAVPTGVDTSYFSPTGQAEAASTLVFTGSMDWLPNEDAVLYFLDAILPRIRLDVPDVSLSVVGRRPTARVLAAAAKSGVRVTGTVDDVRPYIAEAAVYVVPLRIGGGTRLKIFEALAMQKAVVSTTVGAEGLPLVPGTHFVQEDDPAGFARAVVSLLRDPDRRRRLAIAGRQLVEERYSWRQVAHAFEAKCQEAVEAPRPSSGRAGWIAPARTQFKRVLPRPILDHVRAVRNLKLRDQSIYWKLRLERALASAQQAPSSTPAGIRSVLFVCSGNIIRSPMAGALLKRHLSGAACSSVCVASAGLHATVGRSADARARTVAARFGISLEDHRAEPVTDTLVRRADLILPMDCLNEAELLGRYPEARHKIYPLGRWVDGRRPPQTEIVDPYDGDLEDIRRCYELLQSSICNLTSGLLRPAEPQSY